MGWEDEVRRQGGDPGKGARPQSVVDWMAFVGEGLSLAGEMLTYVAVVVFVVALKLGVLVLSVWIAIEVLRWLGAV